MWAQTAIFIITAALAFFQLAKDWKGHQHHWRRLAVTLAIILLMFLGIYNARRSSKNAKDEQTLANHQHQEDLQQITGLKTAVDTANQNQAENTKTFVKQFGDMSKQLADLKTQVRTEELQKRVNQLQGELEKNIKAMQPPDKIKLTWSFFDLSQLKDISPITETTVPRNGGTIHTDVTLENDSATEARDVEFTVIICDRCIFAKEPPGFVHPAGTPEQLRLRDYPRLSAHSITEAIPLDILIPVGTSRIEIGMTYRCGICATPRTEEHNMHINISDKIDGKS